MRSFTEGELRAVEAIRALNAKKSAESLPSDRFGAARSGGRSVETEAGVFVPKVAGAEHSGGQTVLFLLPARCNGDIISKDLS